MTEPVIVVVASSAAVAAIVIASACGGKIYGNPPGYVDDAGVFRGPDGAIMFGPSSACLGYDSDSFAQIDSTVPCSSDDDCAKWLSTVAPPNYVVAPSCFKGFCNPYLVVSPPQPPSEHPLYCTPGSSGDAYCAAVFEQFLLGDAHVWSACGHECQMVDPENAPPYCASGTDYYACVTGRFGQGFGQGCACDDAPIDNLELCVYRGDAGLAHCEAPCTPPPVTVSDGGVDQ